VEYCESSSDLSLAELVLTRLGLVAIVPPLFARWGLRLEGLWRFPRLDFDRRTGKAGIVVGNSPRILVVAGLSETTAVIKAVFEPRGHAVNRVRQSQLPGNSTTAPLVVVWHADESDPAPVADRFQGIPRIFIGRADCPASDGETQRFSQPFEYRELLGTIESLLAQADVA